MHCDVRAAVPFSSSGQLEPWSRAALLRQVSGSEGLELEYYKQLSKELRYLPDDKNPMVRLAYLTKVVSGGICSPFTEEQHDAFVSGRLAGCMAAGCLVAGGALVALTFPVSCTHAGTVFCVSGIAAKVISSVSELTSCFSSTVNFFSTGVCPRYESNEANAAQNRFHDAEKDYEVMAVCLIRLWKDYPQMAHSFATSLKIKGVMVAMSNDVSAELSRDLLDPLQKAKRFVRKGIVPASPPSVQLAAEFVLVQRRLEAIEKQLIPPAGLDAGQ